MLKKAILSCYLIGLPVISFAEDYYLDATTMEIGATAGENLVVKEGCLDPEESSCGDKFKWFASVSPVKIGNLQIVGQLTDDFEVVLTADFDPLTKNINVLTANNKGLGLSFGEGEGMKLGNYKFYLNGIGNGGASSSFSPLPGWNKTDFNEVKIIVQQGVANVYTNGQLLRDKSAITFDTDTVFERVAIEGITHQDRLIDVKVRGIQRATGCSTSSIPTTPDTSTPTPSENCMANYSLDGQLHVPCVSVPNVFGGIIVYDIKMQQQAGRFTFDLDMNSIKTQ